MSSHYESIIEGILNIYFSPTMTQSKWFHVDARIVSVSKTFLHFKTFCKFDTEGVNLEFL